MGKGFDVATIRGYHQLYSWPSGPGGLMQGASMEQGVRIHRTIGLLCRNANHIHKGEPFHRRWRSCLLVYSLMVGSFPSLADVVSLFWNQALLFLFSLTLRLCGSPSTPSHQLCSHGSSSFPFPSWTTWIHFCLTCSRKENPFFKFLSSESSYSTPTKHHLCQ